MRSTCTQPLSSRGKPLLLWRTGDFGGECGSASSASGISNLRLSRASPARPAAQPSSHVSSVLTAARSPSQRGLGWGSCGALSKSVSSVREQKCTFFKEPARLDRCFCCFPASGLNGSSTCTQPLSSRGKPLLLWRTGDFGGECGSASSASGISNLRLSRASPARPAAQPSSHVSSVLTAARSPSQRGLGWGSCGALSKSVSSVREQKCTFFKEPARLDRCFCCFPASGLNGSSTCTQPLSSRGKPLLLWRTGDFGGECGSASSASGISNLMLSRESPARPAAQPSSHASSVLTGASPSQCALLGLIGSFACTQPLSSRGEPLLLWRTGDFGGECGSASSASGSQISGCQGNRQQDPLHSRPHTFRRCS